MLKVKVKSAIFLFALFLMGIGLCYFTSLPKYSIPEIKKSFYAQEEKYRVLVDAFNDIPDLLDFPIRIVVSSKLIEHPILKRFLKSDGTEEYLNFYPAGIDLWFVQRTGENEECEIYFFTLGDLCMFLSLELERLVKLKEKMEVLSVRSIEKTLKTTEEISLIVYSDSLAIGDYDAVHLYYSKDIEDFKLIEIAADPNGVPPLGEGMTFHRRSSNKGTRTSYSFCLSHENSLTRLIESDRKEPLIKLQHGLKELLKNKEGLED